MCGAQAAQPLNLGPQAGQLQNARVVRHHGRGNLELAGFAKIFDFADIGVARQCLIDEELLARQRRPHLFVVASLHGIGVQFDLFVLVALADDAPFALFEVGREPRRVKVMQGNKTLLRVDPCAHVLRGSNRNTHAAGVHVAEQLDLG